MLKRLFLLRNELLKFGSVGAVAYVVGVGGFNLLVHIPNAPLADRPITASLISGILSVLVAYVGNRSWTWKYRSKHALHREVIIFFAVNAVGLGFSALSLGISRYVFDLHSALSDNISANIIGVGFGTLFRFIGYRTWVFPNRST
ncbi:MAG: GtrA family protein [Candidatus Nanopelagicaceae bacterium]|nr:GtrA family protein [Candidatus Nanopelagicaceae bacterium]